MEGSSRGPLLGLLTLIERPSVILGISPLLILRYVQLFPVPKTLQTSSRESSCETWHRDLEIKPSLIGFFRIYGVLLLALGGSGVGPPELA
jgi:hypothetical protein